MPGTAMSGARDQPDGPGGLCVTCRHVRVIRSARSSTFLLCQRSHAEPERVLKYPRLPVLRCNGFEPAATEVDRTKPGDEV